MLSRLLYRDGLMLVIDKPAGIHVHRGPKGGASLEDSFDALRFGLPRRPALAHRLDRDTSGCLVLGRHRKALAALGKLFKNGKVGKTYWAVVEGVTGGGRRPHRHSARQARRKPRLVDEAGPERAAVVTTWKVMGRGDGLTWLALEPLTGRTHQLRVHCAEMGWPMSATISMAARRAAAEPMLHLHSREVVVPLYKNKDPIIVTAPVPEHMTERLTACGWKPDQ